MTKPIELQRVTVAMLRDHSNYLKHTVSIWQMLARAADQIEQLQTALKPFGYYYELNDCHERRADDALEVPISDLKRAHDLVGGVLPDR